MEPYTSSVETCNTRAMPWRRHASKTVCAPSTFVTTKSAAPLIERSTWVSAAKFTTASWPGSTSSSRRASTMSPCTNR
jgi:hypothetical protein